MELLIVEQEGFIGNCGASRKYKRQQTELKPKLLMHEKLPV
jgi:hypothetical protein